SQGDDRRLEELRAQQSEAEGRYLALQNELDGRYEAFAGRPSPLEAVQAAIPADAALVGWVDAGRDHAACVVRRTGGPTWVAIPGTGGGGAWTKQDDERPGALRDALRAAAKAGRVGELAAALARQRLGPLRPHLPGARRLIVLPSPALAGLPIEALLAAGPGPEPVGSYAPPATMFARPAPPRARPPRPAPLL